MAAPCPKTPRDKAPLGVCVGPAQPRTQPFVLIELYAAVLERLKRVLLIVGRELGGQCDERKHREGIVGSSERGARLHNCGMRWHTEEKQDDVLDDS